MLTGTLVPALSGLGFVVAASLALGGRVLSAGARSVATAVAAGTLLAVVLADLLPEALDLSGDPAVWGVAGGFGLLLAADAVARGRARARGRGDRDGSATTIAPFVVGIAIHNAADGFSLGVGSELSVSAALGIGAGVLVHQIPVGLSLAAVLVTAGRSRREVLGLAILLGLAIPVAAALTIALPAADDRTLGVLVGVATGTLAYVSAVHLLPTARRGAASGAPDVAFLAALGLTTYLLLEVL